MHYSRVLALLILLLPAVALGQETFTPLTNLPGVVDVANTETLPSFLNNLYRLCIGAAAVIAVLQIMRAGAKLFFNKDSVGQNREAKQLITNSILGLLLVLSPAIVFGIINPDILDLQLDVSGLKSNLKKDPNPVPQADPFNSGGPLPPSATVTGTLLQKATFPTEAEVNAYIPACNALRGTLVANIPADSVQLYTKGCTQQCSPAGQGSCDSKGCREYSAYCGIQASAKPLVNGSRFEPTPQESFKWNAFTEACRSSGGVANFRASGKTEACFDADDKPATCAIGVMSCEPK